jgi:NitT/TauT family transport system permease protein
VQTVVGSKFVPAEPTAADDAAVSGRVPVKDATAAGEQEQPSPARSGRSVLGPFLPLLLPAIVLIAWQIASQNRLIANGLFPPPTVAVGALVDWMFGPGASDGLALPSPYDGTWITHVASSSVRILGGFALGSFVGISFGLFAGVSVTIRRLIDPTINAIRPVSVTAWIPLTLIFFGIGSKPAVFLTALATFFPVYINSFDGAQFAEGRLVRAALMLGASRRQILLRVTLPAALPNIAVGLRVAAAIAWTTVVVAEILGAKSGLGFVLMDSYNQFRFDYIVAAMISLGACGFITDKLLQLAFARPLRWIEQGAKS